MFKHEDNRRNLYEITGDCKVVKIIVMKEDGKLGNHFHLKKHEKFCLIKGSGEYTMGNRKGKMKLFEEYDCPPKMRHEFNLKKGAILVGTASELFDINDELK